MNPIAAEARRLARRTRRMTLDEWAEYRAEYKRETHRDAEPAWLGPSSAFSDREVTAAMRRQWRYEVPEAQTGRQSQAVTHRLALAGAGWKRPPRAAEFYDAVRAKRRTARRACVIAAWLREATLLEWWYGIFEGVYTWRQTGQGRARPTPGALPELRPTERAEPGMNKDKELELHGTPKALYDRVRAGLEGETQRAGLPLHVGGGGVLEARWDHRESLDIDVVIPPDNPDAARSALDRAAEQSGGYRVQGPGFDRIEFPDRPQEEHVDVGFSQTTGFEGEPLQPVAKVADSAWPRRGRTP